ncbi:MAG: alpha/beta fold hydrolase [Cellulosilyticum sp.]|nr:alpha/beta fold hydrolase [Cellulosilyticum sp.]
MDTYKKMKKQQIRKRYIIGFLGMCLVLSSIWELSRAKNELKEYKPVGQMVDVGTYEAHCYTKTNVKNEAEYAFVFITGSGTPCAYTDFYRLQEQLSAYGQTITFDHAGLGWSINATTPRKVESLVTELATIIETLAKDKKVILLCHSLGSLEAIGYAQTYPEQVKGIIFLDSGSPEFYSTDSELMARVMNRSFALGRASGLNRLLGKCNVFLPLYGEHLRNHQLPEKISTLDEIMYYHYTGSLSTYKSIGDMNKNAKSVLEGNDLGDMPIFVLSSDSGKAWQKTQEELAT